MKFSLILLNELSISIQKTDEFVCKKRKNIYLCTRTLTWAEAHSRTLKFIKTFKN